MTRSLVVAAHRPRGCLSVPINSFTAYARAEGGMDAEAIAARLRVLEARRTCLLEGASQQAASAATTATATKDGFTPPSAEAAQDTIQADLWELAQAVDVAAASPEEEGGEWEGSGSPTSPSATSSSLRSATFLAGTLARISTLAVLPPSLPSLHAPDPNLLHLLDRHFLASSLLHPLLREETQRKASAAAHSPRSSSALTASSLLLGVLSRHLKKQRRRLRAHVVTVLHQEVLSSPPSAPPSPAASPNGRSRSCGRPRALLLRRGRHRREGKREGEGEGGERPLSSAYLPLLQALARLVEEEGGTGRQLARTMEVAAEKIVRSCLGPSLAEGGGRLRLTVEAMGIGRAHV